MGDVGLPESALAHRFTAILPSRSDLGGFSAARAPTMPRRP